MSKPVTLSIRNFGQLREVDLKLADLTVLVGAQGTGKSLALQWLKAALDGRHLINLLRQAGQHATGANDRVELIFGVGMGAAWTRESEVRLDGKKINPENLGMRGADAESVFFIPAHRAMLITDGWAAPFQRLTSDTPAVARIFSQNLHDRFSERGGERLFPVERQLKKEYRDLIAAAVFHGGTVALEEDQQHARRLRLAHGDANLPFMTWSAGQREFAPLLLGLYHLLPRTHKAKQEEIDWVIIEEPEMGLHPQALNVVLLLVLDLLWRGYRVVVSTHSPHVLTAVWMLQRLKQHHARWQRVCQAFDAPSSVPLSKVAQCALERSYRVHFLAFERDGKVASRDISDLDPDSADAREAEWGGLTGFSSRFGDAVREAVNEAEE
ncbi:MAG: ATP-binding protein [Deltaproteobacteria bacterium]|nr:ATP-binding protein [Deltaproteobacteria bacterium]